MAWLSFSDRWDKEVFPPKLALLFFGAIYLFNQFHYIFTISQKTAKKIKIAYFDHTTNTRNIQQRPSSRNPGLKIPPRFLQPSKGLRLMLGSYTTVSLPRTFSDLQTFCRDLCLRTETLTISRFTSLAIELLTELL